MQEETAFPLLTSVDNRGVGQLTLNCPQKHNAFNDEMIVLLTEAIQKFNSDPKVKLIVLKSNGKNFSAGADLAWMRNMAKFSEAENHRDALALGNMMHALYTSSKPILGQVQGMAFGGGVGLVACCAIVIASRDASFCFSEVKLGLIPAVISPYIIQAIGYRWAHYYFLTAQSFTADTAHTLGLCHHVVDKADLEATTQKQIDLLLQNGPQALSSVNRALNHLQPLPITLETIDYTAKLIAKIRVSPEGQEGLNAFLEKRPPNWIEEKSKKDSV